MRKKFFIATAVSALLSMFSSCSSNEIDYTTGMLQPGDTAPDFTLKAPDGITDVKLSDYKGKYVVVDFWASWCPDCQNDMPNMVNIYNEFKDKDVAFIGISFDMDRDAWKKGIATYGIEYAQCSELKKWKKETTIDSIYHVKWIPSMYLVNPAGKIVYGTVYSDRFKSKLEEIIK